MMTNMKLVADGVGVGDRLHDVSLALASGTLVAVVGENGAGKTTLLDALAGVRRAERGRVTLDGVDVAALPPRDRARRIASLGQQVVDVDCTVLERIAQGLAPRRGTHALVDDAAVAAVRSVAERLGVATFLERELASLSAGERRRVDVARALVDDGAGVVIVDEPHAAVDVRHQALVSSALRARAAAGAVVVVSVHDLGLAATIAERVVGLRAGRVVVDGAPDAVITSEGVEQLYGVKARVVRDGGGVAVLVVGAQ